jgi:hypothetical protein
MPPAWLRATFVLAMPPAWLRANVPNVRSDGHSVDSCARPKVRKVTLLTDARAHVCARDLQR